MGSHNLSTSMQSSINNITVTEDMTMVPPYNNSELHAAGTLVVGSHNLEKPQPYFLANQLTGAGNSGAVLYLQHLGLRKITHLTNKFYLQALDITRRERVQILETFGAPVASFFGESARVYNFSGVALDSDTTRSGTKKGEYFHGTSLLYLYDNFMRGTKLIENNSIAILQVNNHSIYGYPLQFSYRALSELDKAIQFSFSMFVKDHVYALPGVIDTTMMKRNVGLQNVNNAQADALEALRDLLAPVITTLKYRQDSRWLDIQKEATSASENIAVAVEALTDGDVTASEVTTAGDAIKAARSSYEAKANDYITALMDILPDPPSAAQRSYFGLTGNETFESVPVGTGGATEWRKTADWADFIKTDLNIAWEWMPYASKTNFVATNVTESSSPTAQILNGDMSEYIPLEGQAQIDKIKEYTQDDEKLGNFAKNILTQINSVDNLLLKRLASFYQNIAAGNATNEDFLII